MKDNLLSFSLSIIILFVLNYIRSLVPLFIGKVFSLLGAEGSTTLPLFLDRMFDNTTVPGGIFLVALAIIATALVRDALNFWADVEIAHVSEGVGYNLQTDFYHHIQDLPYSYLNHAETGDLIQRSISDIGRVKRFFSQILLNMVNSFARIIMIAIQMLIINWQYSLLILVFIPILFGVSLAYFKKMQPTFTQIEEDEGELTTVVQENYTGIRVVKAFANENYEISKFRKALHKFENTWEKLMKRMAVYWGISDGFSYFMLLYSLGLAIVFARNGDLSLNKIISLFLFIQAIMWPTRALARQIGELSRSDIASSRILEIVDTPTEYTNDRAVAKPEIKGKITFENVGFQFHDSSAPTLKGVNLEIKAGETIALIGKTGSGKSTLVSLLNRMLDPTEGKLLIDGVDIATIDKKYIRKKVGVVLQEPFLYSRTIAENIGVVMEKRELSTIKSVAEIASIDYDIERFDKGYETLVGERGATLSGGQKQRISIARMLVDNKPILIFDDSLSAVDTETDLKIRTALKKRQHKTTTLIITHRITTAMDADRIVVLEDGKIAEIGSHAELIARPGLYQNIWNIQNFFNSEEGGDE